MKSVNIWLRLRVAMLAATHPSTGERGPSAVSVFPSRNAHGPVQSLELLERASERPVLSGRVLSGNV